MLQNQSSATSRDRFDYRKNIAGWTREIFFLFYGVFFISSLIDKIIPGHGLIHYGFRFAFAIHSPAILFALGCRMGLCDPRDPDYRRDTLKKALRCYLCFFVIGLLEEILTGHDVFTSIKDILIIVRVPDISSVFLAMCFLLVICACFPAQIEYIITHRAVLILVSAAGFLLSFIPEGFLGYGLIGTLIGGSTTNCTAIAYYLFLFFLGMLFARNPERGIFRRETFGLFAVLVLAEGVLVLLRFRHPAIILAGIICACFFLGVSVFLFPLFVRAEDFMEKLSRAAKSFFASLLAKSHEGGPAGFLVYYAGYTLLFLVMAFLIFFPYINEGRTLIWYVDGIGQYIPKAIRFMRCMPPILKDVLHGNLDYQQYDFTTGLGSTFTVSHEPVYWLNLFFRPSQVEFAYNLQLIVRYFLSGVSMSAMLRYFRKSNETAWLGSMVYAFCGYAIYTGTKHGLFLVPMILLPLLIIAMEELITKKKWYLLTVLTAISLLSSYYFLYMNTIALGIYFVVRILCTKEYRNIKTFITRGLIIVGSYLIGAAMGSLTLFNSFGGYVGSSRSSGGSVSSFLSSTPLFYRPLWISDFFVGFISDYYSPGLWLRIGLAPLALLSIVFVFTRTRKKEIKPIFLLLTLFCLVPAFGYILNGFSNVSNRWCYIYIICIVFIMAEYLEDFRSLTGTETLVMCTITAFYGVITFLTLKHRTDTGLGSFGLLTITLLALIILNNEQLKIPPKTGQRIIIGVTLLSVILNANMYITNTSGEVPHMENYVKNGTSMKKLSHTALRFLDEVDPSGGKDDFYRSTNLYTYGNTRSSSLVFGYNDLSIFNSTLNGGVVNYNRQMGNSDFNIVSIYSYNFRTIMNELASVRYMGTDSTVELPMPYGYREVLKKDSDSLTYSIFENEYALPLGYTYTSVISDTEAEKLSAAEKQELTMMSAIVDEEDMEKAGKIRHEKSPALTVHELPVTGTDLNNIEYEKGMITIGEPAAASGEGSMTLHFDGEANAETYVVIRGDIVFPKDGLEHFINCNVKAKGVNYNHKFRVDAYSTGQEEYILNLGYHKEPIRKCRLTFKDPGQISCKEIRVLSQSMDTYAARAAALKEHSLEDVKVTTNTVTGHISADQDRFLVISLPFQSGWTAWVDGEETTIQRANYQYMGISLPAGDHEIRLHYRLPGQRATIYCTSAGVLVFAAIILFNWLRKKRARGNAPK